MTVYCSLSWVLLQTTVWSHSPARDVDSSLHDVSTNGIKSWAQLQALLHSQQASVQSQATQMRRPLKHPTKDPTKHPTKHPAKHPVESNTQLQSEWLQWQNFNKRKVSAPNVLTPSIPAVHISDAQRIPSASSVSPQTSSLPENNQFWPPWETGAKIGHRKLPKWRCSCVLPWFSGKKCKVWDHSIRHWCDVDYQCYEDFRLKMNSNPAYLMSDLRLKRYVDCGNLGVAVGTVAPSSTPTAAPTASILPTPFGADPAQAKLPPAPSPVLRVFSKESLPKFKVGIISPMITSHRDSHREQKQAAACGCSGREVYGEGGFCSSWSSSDRSKKFGDWCYVNDGPRCSTARKGLRVANAWWTPCDHGVITNQRHEDDLLIAGGSNELIKRSTAVPSLCSCSGQSVDGKG